LADDTMSSVWIRAPFTRPPASLSRIMMGLVDGWKESGKDRGRIRNDALQVRLLGELVFVDVLRPHADNMQPPALYTSHT
jgi:hypothetical protein